MKIGCLSHTHSEVDDALRKATQAMKYGPSEWTIDGIADGSEPNGHITVTTPVTHSPGGWGSCWFTAYSGITSITIDIDPSLNAGADSVFAGMTKLESVRIKRIKSFPRQWFNNCSGLKSVVWDRDCAAVPGSWMFNGCTSLEFVDMGNCPSINTNAGFPQSPLKTLILRRTDNPVTYGPIKTVEQGGTGCTIYVPEALIESYKVDTNWAVYDAYGTITWKAIEGSEYE